MHYSELVAVLKNRREELGVTQEHLAELARVWSWPGESVYQRIEVPRCYNLFWSASLWWKGLYNGRS